MGRFVTMAIIALALGGATVESFAADAGSATTQGTPRIQPIGPGANPNPNDDQGSVGSLLADAAAPGGPAGGPDGQMPAPPPPGPPQVGFGDRGPGPGMPPPLRFLERIRHMEATWGLFFNHRDKNLSNADVQVLAQAILLMHGNHDWKVVNVADGQDGQATFAYATADGSVIARFAIDRMSGRLSRIG